MPFQWNDNPNLPTVTPPEVLGPNEVSTQVHVVANTVNVSPIFGVLSYNTTNIGYDVVYALPSLNVRDLHVTHLNADNVYVEFNAAINTANIIAASINTANIVNATIANGVMGVNPTSNLQIATKEYVDALAANSTPLGGNLQLLIQAAGDLLVGVSDNTAERLPVGNTDGQVLTAFAAAGNTGIHWVGPVGSTTSHRGLTIGTNWETSFMNTQIVLQRVDEIVMDDGYRSNTGWDGLVANNLSNVATSGVGYLDTGVVQPNSCYEIYAIRNSITGDQGLLLHRTKDTQVDTNYNSGPNAGRNMNFNNGSGSSRCLNVAQKFVATRSGPLVGIDVQLMRVGTPRGNVWLTLEDNIANNNTSGIILATSRKLSAAGVGLTSATDTVRARFPFDISANVISGNAYWFVVQSDYAIGNIAVPAYIRVMGDSSVPVLQNPNGPAKFFNANTGGWANANSILAIDAQFGSTGPSNLYHRTFIEANDSSVLMPTGYDQKCLLSYASTTKRGFFREYHQNGYKMTMAFHYTWCFYNRGGLQGVQGTDMSTANNDVNNTSYSEAVNMGVFAPPVPCLVWFYKYTGINGAVHSGLGGISCTAWPGQGFSETNNGLNLVNGAQSFGVVGPIFIEFGCVTNINGTFGNLYVAGIEF